MNNRTKEAESLNTPDGPFHRSMRQDVICSIIVFVAVTSSAVALSASIKAALILAGLSSATTLIMCAMAHETYYAIRSRKWPSAPGTVITSQTLSLPGNKSAANIKIRYEVDGIVYDCRRIQFGPQTTHRSGVERMLCEYREGTQVTVYYDPAHPGLSICKPGFTHSFFFYVGGIAVCSYGGAELLAEAIRGKL